jgi:hypothetical protein
MYIPSGGIDPPENRDTRTGRGSQYTERQDTSAGGFLTSRIAGPGGALCPLRGVLDHADVVEGDVVTSGVR